MIWPTITAWSCFSIIIWLWLLIHYTFVSVLPTGLACNMTAFSTTVHLILILSWMHFWGEEVVFSGGPGAQLTSWKLFWSKWNTIVHLRINNKPYSPTWEYMGICVSFTKMKLGLIRVLVGRQKFKAIRMYWRSALLYTNHWF